MVRYSCPLIVTRTGGFLPAPSRSITSGGTTIPVACLPVACCRTAAKLIEFVAESMAASVVKGGTAVPVSMVLGWGVCVLTSVGQVRSV